MTRATKLVAGVLSAIVFVSLARVSTESAFPVFSYVRSRAEYVLASAVNSGQLMTRFLWTYRSLDVAAEAFLIFAAAACCIAIMRQHQEEKQA